MIHEVLHIGRDNPTTGKELAALFGTNIRKITAAIEEERQQGYPICAAQNPPEAGYYIAEDPEELERYCNQLQRRIDELQKTHLAMMNSNGGIENNA